MKTVNVTINDINWPILDVIINRDGKIKHLRVHHDRVDRESTDACADSIKLALDEVKQEHNPRSM